MSFPRYPKYKYSDVELLGEVPEHWEVKRLKFAAHIEAGQSPPSEFVLDGTDGLPFLQGNAEFGTLHPVARQVCEYTTKRAKRGDILLSVRAPVGELNIADREYGIGRGLCAIRPEGVFHAGFCYFLLLVDRDLLHAVATGSTYDAVSTSDVGDLPALLPPLIEQQAIKQFLDEETFKIDSLITEQQRLIELLKESRSAIIAHAITKGLSRDAPMKWSGIEAIGEIPSHWAVERIKWVAQMESGHTPDKKIPAYWENCQIPWVSLYDTGHLKDNDYISETVHCVSDLGIANSSAHILPSRAVVFSRDATIGRCAITTRPMAVSQHFIAWICGETILPEYLLQRLRTMTEELDRLTFGATVKTIGMADVKTLVTPLPPVEEQRAIVCHLLETTSRIDLLIASADEAVKLLRDRRTALVFAAVTGQIDVRALASVAVA